MRDLYIVALAAALAGCGDRALNGNPSDTPEAPDPRTVVTFANLYELNCSGCHGRGGEGGLAVGLASRGYLAYAPDATIRDVIANGRPGTAMPPFATRAGGMLSDEQIDAIVAGIRAWAPGPAPTPQTETAAGDPARGGDAFRGQCAWCHGPDGRGGPGGSSIADDSFLALTSDASLRTTIVAGRPELGCPGGRSRMTALEVSDTVAWLAAQRVPVPGQPYPDGSKR